MSVSQGCANEFRYLLYPTFQMDPSLKFEYCLYYFGFCSIIQKKKIEKVCF